MLPDLVREAMFWERNCEIAVKEEKRCGSKLMIECIKGLGLPDFIVFVGFVVWSF